MSDKNIVTDGSDSDKITKFLVTYNDIALRFDLHVETEDGQVHEEPMTPEEIADLMNDFFGGMITLMSFNQIMEGFKNPGGQTDV